MRRSDHFFEDCEIGVVPGQVQSDSNPAESTLVSVLRIDDKAQGETFFYPLTDEVRRKLIRDLTSGITVATADEVQH